MAIWHRTETAADDDARTNRLLDGAETAYETRTGGDGSDLDDFEDVIVTAAAPKVGDTYPPPGHGYPRR